MPVFQIGLDDGRSLRIEADDQEAALAGVQHFQASEKPSGVGSAFAKGVSDTAGGIASTLGLTGAKSETLDTIAAKTAPKDYKAAPLIREGGSWMNPADYQPGNLPQIMAQAAPGMAMDLAAGKTGGAIGAKVGGARGALIGGAGSVLASIAARTFGKGAHDNAEARTGDSNADVTGVDLLREGGKQALAAPLNAFGGARLAGITGKAAGVGASGAGKAVMNQLGTMGAEGAAGGVTSAVNQLGTSVGQEHGKPFEGNQVAEAAVGGGLTSGALVAPRMYGQLKNAGKFRDFGGANKDASTELANEINTAANGSALVGKLGGTKTAAHATDTAVRNNALDLAAAAKDVELSPDNTNTLQRIQSGGKANGRDLAALDAEAPEVGHLARKALIGAKLKSMGNFSENSFSGGLSGLMDKSVKAVANPVGAAAVAGSSAIAGSTGVLGSVGLPVLGTIAGGYMAARAMDKLTGARSPAKGFTDTFADPNAPGRPAPPAPPEVDPNYDPTTLRQSLNTNAKLEEGIAKIAGKLGKAKAKAMTAEAEPLLEQLAATREPEVPQPTLRQELNTNAGLEEGMARMANRVALEKRRAVAAEAPPAPEVVISPIAKKMLQEKLREGLPPEATAPAAPAPAPEPSLNPNMLPRAITGPAKNIMAGLRNSGKIANTYDTATRQSAGVEEARSLAADNPLINEMGGVAANSNPAFAKEGSQLLRAASVRKRLLAQPEEEAPPLSPAAAIAAEPATGPASEPIAALMAKLSKKSGEDLKQTPHPEADQPFAPLPEEELYRRHLTDEQMVEHEFAKYEPAQRKMYGKKSVENREGNREDTLGAAADFAAEDRSAANALYHQLDHTKDPDVARKVIDHYTGLMSPQAAAAIKERYTPAKIAKRWKKKK